jgi:hypothetical protein
MLAEQSKNNHKKHNPQALRTRPGLKMKNLNPNIIFRVILILLLIALLSSCSTEKKLKKAINNHGQKESVAFIVATYPEYFKRDSIIIKDTIRQEIPIYLPEYVIDSTFADLADSLVIENDKLRVQLRKVPTGWQLSATSKADTLYKFIEIPIEVPCPPITCPDIDKIQIHFNKWPWVFIGFILGIIFTLLTIGIFIYIHTPKIDND